MTFELQVPNELVMLEITVLNPDQHFQTTMGSSTFNIGANTEEGKNDIVINDPLVSDYQCRVEVFEVDGREKLRILNLGGSMVLGSNARIHHLSARETEIPCCLGAGDTYIQITRSDPIHDFDQSIQHLQAIGSSENLVELPNDLHDEASPSPETLSSWFEALGAIQRSTAGQKTFFKLAARSVFNPGGLDGCLILRRNPDWNIVAQHIPYPTDGIFYRRDLVEQAYRTKLPLFHDNSLLQETESVNDLHAAVVCPVFDEDRNVQAIVYGFRNCNSGNKRRGIRRLEAKFVNLIADSISAGMIRLDQEADSARQRILLEQAFSPKVARQLEANPDFLDGTERDVTVLFADLRGFCRISESVGANVTYQLLTDVMNRFTKIVHQHDGVIIDFYGDGMSAFWNAPVDQPEHPSLACQAGMAIQSVMTELNDSWAVEIGQRLRVGIGINSGIAQVGNSGSQIRLKYGPQGSAVNIASRLEQSTKKLGVNLVVSESTAQRVKERFITRRVCNAKLEGFGEPMGIYTLIEPINFPKMSHYFEIYANALQLFERQQYLDALEVLTNLAESETQAGLPMLEFLLNQINSRLKAGSEPDAELASEPIAICLK